MVREYPLAWRTILARRWPAPGTGPGIGRKVGVGRVGPHKRAFVQRLGPSAGGEAISAGCWLSKPPGTVRDCCR